MASQPGPLTQWPWQKLGNMKYAILFPWAAHSMYKVIMCDDKNLLNLTILPTLLLRLLHTQLWITLSRFQTAKGKHRIVTKSLEFEQVDRERNWDDQILLTALLFYMGGAVLPGTRNLPWWNTKGAVFTILLHAGPVEFLYYWFHRALHHHFLYSRYHSHHHASIVTEPITSVIHPFAEEMVYFMLFAIPVLTMLFTGTGSIIAAVGYLIYIDFMNYMGHCNFELVPKLLFHVFPPLKYLMYTPSFHSLHHTQFRTNYSLFMPLYDCIYGTVDASTDRLYEESLNGKEEVPNVIHLTHLTSLQSIYHLRFGFASLASKQYAAKWYLWIMWPLTFMWTMLMCLCRTTFTVEKHRLKGLHMETWAVPRYNFQYTSKSGREEINGMIEKAILEAEERGTKVMSLGLLNQDEPLNEYGSLYLRKNPKLKMKIIDGTSLAVAVVLNSIPRGTKEVLLVGNISKMAYVLASSLCQKGVQVVTIQRDQYQLLKLKLSSEICKYLVFSKSYSNKIWLVGDGLSEKDQMKAAKGVHIIPFSQFPPKMMRRDCIYHRTPALKVPKVYENLHTCENWLPRRVMSAWRVAGIVHALEEWDEHECGDTTADIKKVWDATLEHGFVPYEHL